MRVACIQLNSGTDISENIAAADTLIRDAAADGADFVLTPEMTHLMQRKPNALFDTIHTQENDPGVAQFSALANALKIHLLIGSLAIRTRDKRAVNRSFLFGPDGAIIDTYDKIHLFDVTLSKSQIYRESQVYDGGNKAVLADIGTAKIGMSVCYDLRFPKLYRHYGQAGAHILTVPAAFTRPTGKAHWETLLRARAIETGSYVMAAAQGGKHDDGRETWGHSMMIDPWGEVIAHLEHDQPGFICADLDLEKVRQARRKIPAWQHEPHYAL